MLFGFSGIFINELFWFIDFGKVFGLIGYIWFLDGSGFIVGGVFGDFV